MILDETIRLIRQQGIMMIIIEEEGEGVTILETYLHLRRLPK
jgi:hypothetical protein